MQNTNPITIDPTRTTLLKGPYCPRQYAEDASLMNEGQREVYHALVSYQVREGYIPDDLRQLQRICTGCSEWHIFEVLSTRYVLTRAGYRHRFWSFGRQGHVMRIAHDGKKEARWSEFIN